jgi:hypothetical protein
MGSGPQDFDASRRVKELLQELCKGQKPKDDSPPTASDTALDQLHYKEFPALRCAHTSLTINSKNTKIDVLFWACMTGMACV